MIKTKLYSMAELVVSPEEVVEFGKSVMGGDK